MRQSDLAQTVGISPSYLNLIEHNRRRIAGKLLADIARALDIDAGILDSGAERELIEKLQSAATQSPISVEISRTEELATRYPGWSGLISEQSDRISGLETKVHELTQRLTHDQSLSASIHAVISAVTSIRSAASILNSDEKLDDDWQRRFHQNIHNDSIRLATDSEELVKFLEQPSTQSSLRTANEEVEEWFLSNSTTLQSLELDPSSLQSVIESTSLGGAAGEMLARELTTFVADATDLNYEEFAKLAQSLNYQPYAIWEHTGARYVQILRRLATLRPEDGHPPTGLAVCDASGTLLNVKRSADFTLQRSGDLCANWPMFAAMGQLGRPTFATVVLPGNPETKLRCYAVAEQLEAKPGQPPRVVSTMLVVSDVTEAGSPEIKVGPTCRICPWSGCGARRESSVLGIVE